MHSFMHCGTQWPFRAYHRGAAPHIDRKFAGTSLLTEILLRLRILYINKVGVWFSKFQIRCPDFPSQNLPPWVSGVFPSSKIRYSDFAPDFAPVGEWFSESKNSLPRFAFVLSFCCGPKELDRLLAD